MNKRFVYIFLAIFLAFVFYFKTSIENNILYIFNQTKSNINSIIQYFDMKIDTYFNQAYKIEKLTKTNEEYQKFIAKTIPLLKNYQELQKLIKIKNPKVIFTQTISYSALPDMSQIYITYDNNITHPLGLICNNQTAGIVTKKIKNFSLALLNNNPNTSYTVFIGKDKIPGVVFGGEKMMIKYIPKYHKININDIVITSGLDNIFYEGLRVGKVISVSKTPLYQEAVVKPFYNPLHPKFFYVVVK